MLNRPDVIQGVHESMLEAGAEVLETDTFQASAASSSRSGASASTRSRSTARPPRSPARRPASSASSPARSARPATCPRATTPRSARSPSASSSRSSPSRRSGLVEGGADLLIIETAQDILEVKAAIFGAREAFKLTGRTLPIQASVSLLPNGGKMLLGTDIQAVLTTLTALDVDVIGLNCSTGPEDMRDAIRYLGEISPLPVHCIPNAGLPLQGPEARRSSPRSPTRWRTRCRSSSSATASRSWAAAAAPRPSTSRAIVDRVGGREAAARPQRGRAARVER